MLDDDEFDALLSGVKRAPPIAPTVYDPVNDLTHVQRLERAAGAAGQIEAWFREGVVAREQNTQARGDVPGSYQTCPYPNEADGSATLAKHWWTRGYAYTSRLINWHEAERGCPCKHVTPCQEMCSCANGLYSAGCLRCCKYGSKEQQKAVAERLATVLDNYGPNAPEPE